MKWYRRRETYLIAGIVFGILIMVFPAVINFSMGPISPFYIESIREEVFGAQAITTPIDALWELIWLSLPAIFIVIVIYWAIGRRRRWAGYDEAVKWARR